MMQEDGLDVQTLFNQKFRAVLGPTRFPDSSVGKESACSAGDPSSVPGSGRSAGEGIVFLGFPGGSAGKETTCNAGDLGSILGLGRPLEKGKATYSSILAWRIPWTEELGGLQSTGS